MVASAVCGGPVTNCAVLTIQNRAPTALEDTYTTAEDTTLEISAPGLLANDADPDGDSLGAVVLTSPRHGTLTVGANGAFTYTPSLNYTGADAFTYLATDGDLDSAVATVSITVTPVNDAPVAANDFYDTVEDTRITIAAPGVLANDSDVDGDALGAVLVSGPAHGTLELSANGSFVYTPSLNYTGLDVFTYRATDGALSSGVATVTIAIAPENDPPVANNDNYSTVEETPLTVTAAAGVLANDADSDGDILVALLVSSPAHGTLNLSGTGAFTYTPSLNYTGLDTFTYRAWDGQATSSLATVTITITPVNDAPVASNDTYTVQEDATLTVLAPGVLANDFDVDGDALTTLLVGNTTHGTLTLSTNGAFAYTPSLNYTGVDVFTYQVTDGALTSGVATVTITIRPVNDAPVAVNDAYTTSEDTALTVAARGVLANDSDVDGDILTTVLVSSPTHGTLSLSANGAFTYSPSLNYTGLDTFTYRASDGALTSGVATVTITVTPVNDVPVANNDAYTTAEDTVLTIPAPGVLANDSDVDGDALTAVLVSNPTHGSLNLSANGAFVYTPSLNYTGLDTFTYRAIDGALTSSVASVTITVTPVNDAPVAANDAYTTPEDTVLTIPASGVLANDSDVDGNALTTVLVGSTTHGTLNLSANGAFVYTPSLNYTGLDTFTYRASDGQTNSPIATVTITITPVNDTPVANNDAYSIAEDTTLTMAAPGVLANDNDVDGDGLTTVLVSNPSHGSLSLSASGAFTYTPSLNYTGLDTFTYRASDGQTSSPVATVTITITPVNDTPVANNDAYSVAEDTTLTMAAPGVLANDSDVDGDALTAVLVSNPAHGSLSLSASGAFTYTPSLNYTGTDSFTYRASDGQTSSPAATVTITITPVNDTPVANNDAYSIAEDTTLTMAAPGVLANDNDVDGDGLTAVLVSNPSHGSLSLSASGAFTYTPSLNYTGTDTFTYRASDGQTNSPIATVTITITPVNDAPVAANDAYSIVEDTVLTIAAPGLLANDSDVDGDALTTMLVSTVSHGTLNLNASGAFSYTPSLSYTGTDTFTYRASDGQTSSPIATVTITITPVNDRPVAANDAYTTSEDTALAMAAPGVLANDSDVDGDTLAAVLVSNPTHGSLSLSASGAFTYTPSLNYTGTDTFTYRASDEQTSSPVATVTITITPVNDIPVANNDTYSIAEDTTLTMAAPGVLANDSDVDGDALTVVLVSTVSHGTLTLNASGAFSYLPSLNYTGVDTFTYRATDGQATSALATVTITITPVNDAPVANNDSYSTAEDTVLTIAAAGVLANDSDADGDALAAVLVSGVAHGTLNLSGTGAFTYTPSLNYTGLDTFTYRASDGQTNSAIATVTITITPVNDVPVANNDAYAIAEDTTLTIAAPGVLANDSDVDGDPLTAVLVSNPMRGTVSLSANGAFVYTPSLNYTGVDTFTYRTSDGQTSSPMATVTITITPINDTPVANSDAYTIAEDTTLTMAAPGVLANDADVDGDALAAVLVSSVSHGTLNLNANGGFVYTPSLNYTGFDTFTYRAADGQATSAMATVTITITPVNDRPTAGAAGDSYSVLEDHSLTVAPGVLANDSDVDGDPLTAVPLSGPAHGTVALQANGSFIYAPAPNYFGPDSFTYAANDGQTNSAPSVVNITVIPVNDAPSFRVGASQRVNFNTGPQTVSNWATSLSVGPANEAGQALNFIVANDNPSLFAAPPAVSPGGTLSYTPAGGAFGVATMTVMVKDDGGTANGGADTSSAQTFTITLNGPPVVNIVHPNNGSVYIGTNTITVVAEASDPDSVVTNVQIFLGTNAIGTFTNTPGFVTLSNMVPAANPYLFRAIAVDDLGLRATSSVVSVTITQSPPVTALGPIALNRQSGLFEQYARITNPTPRSFPNGVRLFVVNLDPTNRVFNATGTSAGVPYIDVRQALPSGSSLDVLIQYYIPSERAVPTPTLIAEPLPFTIPPPPPPVLGSAKRSEAGIILSFATAESRLYYLQSSTDLMHWKTLSGLITGTGGVVTRTNAFTDNRFFRVQMLP